ncbi:MAG: aldo/keto reductase [Firmicutes bacterium]|nr:aldo/keto reductase [Bacillota bacterium]
MKFEKLTDGYILANGVSIPCVGFGTWQTPDDQSGVDAVKAALACGYRHIDTAAVYGNEESVGAGMHESGVKREDIFLTTKLWNAVRGYDETLAAVEGSLERLGTDYLDLYLIHWPNPARYRAQWAEKNAESYRAMETLYREGVLRAIGVSNFKPHHLDALLQTAQVVPQVNQIRLCPGETQAETVAYCTRRNILLQAYSPMGTGKIFGDPTMREMAARYGRSVAQLCVRYSLQRGWLPLPKSVTPARIAENAQVFGFAIESRDIEIIAGLRGSCGTTNDPDTVGF